MAEVKQEISPRLNLHDTVVALRRGIEGGSLTRPGDFEQFLGLSLARFGKPGDDTRFDMLTREEIDMYPRLLRAGNGGPREKAMFCAKEADLRMAEAGEITGPEAHKYQKAAAYWLRMAVNICDPQKVTG